MVVLVTRCGTGLGSEVAEMAARAGHVVYAGVRRPSDVAHLAEYGVRPVVLDVTRHEQHDELLWQIIAEQGHIDAVVVIPGAPGDGDVVSELFARNVLGPWRLIRRALPWLRDHSSAVVFVSRYDRRNAAPHRAIEALTGALRQELRGTKVKVALVEPPERKSLIRPSTAMEIVSILAASGDRTVTAGSTVPDTPSRQWSPPKTVEPRLAQPPIVGSPKEDLGDVLGDWIDEMFECPDETAFDELSDVVPLVARVIAEDGGAVYDMVGPLLCVGRGRDNDIQIQSDGRVSRRHCAFHRRGRSFFVEDLLGTNGTFVEETAITTRRLYGGERVRVGDTRLRFEVADEPFVRVALQRSA